MLHLPASAAVLFGCVLVGSSLSWSTAAKAQPACEPTMPKGSVCSCKLADLHPTQMSIGVLHVKDLEEDGFQKLAKCVAKDEKHAMIVFGPAGAPYIVDGHHHARAMMDLDAEGPTTCEIADVPTAAPISPAAFWTSMEQRHFARLEGRDGVQHPGVYPPDKLTDLENDPFRSLSSWIEDRCHVKLKGDYADFKLADLLRKNPKAIAPRSDSDEEQASMEGLAFLHQPSNSAQVALMADPAGVEAIKDCR